MQFHAKAEINNHQTRKWKTSTVDSFWPSLLTSACLKTEQEYAKKKKI